MQTDDGFLHLLLLHLECLIADTVSVIPMTNKTGILPQESPCRSGGDDQNSLLCCLRPIALHLRFLAEL